MTHLRWLAAKTKIGEQGGTAVAEALKTNRSLTELSLAGEHGGVWWRAGWGMVWMRGGGEIYM